MTAHGAVNRRRGDQTDPARRCCPGAADDEQMSVQLLAHQLVGPRPHQRCFDGEVRSPSPGQRSGLFEELLPAMQRLGQPIVRSPNDSGIRAARATSRGGVRGSTASSSTAASSGRARTAATIRGRSTAGSGPGERARCRRRGRRPRPRRAGGRRRGDLVRAPACGPVGNGESRHDQPRGGVDRRRRSAVSRGVVAAVTTAATCRGGPRIARTAS